MLTLLWNLYDDAACHTILLKSLEDQRDLFKFQDLNAGLDLSRNSVF